MGDDDGIHDDGIQRDDFEKFWRPHHAGGICRRELRQCCRQQGRDYSLGVTDARQNPPQLRIVEQSELAEAKIRGYLWLWLAYPWIWGSYRITSN